MDGSWLLKKYNMKTFNEWLEKKAESWDPETQRYLDWRKQFTAKFPVGEYNPRNGMDRDNLFAGRISWVLDEFGGGEHGKIWDYIGGVNQSENNYYMLLEKLVEREFPEMLVQWKEDGGGRDG